MKIRGQRIEIGSSSKTITRCVYDIRYNHRFRFETGFVQFDNMEIPVWRPSASLEEPWRKGKWTSIYVLRMSRAMYDMYEAVEIEIEGIDISLPKVSTELMSDFKRHLKKADE